MPNEATPDKLAEFEVAPQDDELAKKALMRPQTQKPRETIVQAEVITSKEKKKMEVSPEADLSNSGQSIRNMKVTLEKTAPYRDDGVTTEGAFSIIQDSRSQPTVKRNGRGCVELACLPDPGKDIEEL